jgi:5S rRNA maturation endonuclease (ribonuclease M5)
MTYRAWNTKTVDRAALKELTAAIAQQNTEELEYQNMDEEWSEEKYRSVLAAQQKEAGLLAGILAARGITDPAEALTLLAGEEELSDPMLLTDMDKACERILRAIDEGETIVVFGDYDVDGVTATALLYQHLKGMGAAVKCMLPSREGDGYGLSKNAIQSIYDKGCRLIVTVDNGISAVEEAAFAASLGIDLIITDHHLPHDTLPCRRPQPLQGPVRRGRGLQALRRAGWLPAGRDAGILRRPRRCWHRGRRHAPDRGEPHHRQSRSAPAAKYGQTRLLRPFGRSGPCRQAGDGREHQLRHRTPHQCGGPDGQRCHRFAAGAL